MLISSKSLKIKLELALFLKVLNSWEHPTAVPYNKLKRQTLTLVSAEVHDLNSTLILDLADRKGSLNKYFFLWALLWVKSTGNSIIKSTCQFLITQHIWNNEFQPGTWEDPVSSCQQYESKFPVSKFQRGVTDPNWQGPWKVHTLVSSLLFDLESI